MEGGKLPGGTTQYVPGSTGPSIPLNGHLNSVSCGRCDKSENNLSRCIILKCSRSEFQNGSHWAKIKVSARSLPSGSSRGESISLPSPALRGPCVPSPWSSSSTSKASQSRPSTSHITSICPFLSPSSSLTGPF